MRGHCQSDPLAKGTADPCSVCQSSSFFSVSIHQPPVATGKLVCRYHRAALAECSVCNPDHLSGCLYLPLGATGVYRQHPVFNLWCHGSCHGGLLLLLLRLPRHCRPTAGHCCPGICWLSWRTCGCCCRMSVCWHCWGCCLGARMFLQGGCRSYLLGRVASCLHGHIASCLHGYIASCLRDVCFEDLVNENVRQFISPLVSGMYASRTLSMRTSASLYRLLSPGCMLRGPCQ